MERKKKGHGGRPVGDPIPQRGKVMAYTQATQPGMQPSAHTHTHIKILQTKKVKKKKRKITPAQGSNKKTAHALCYYFYY